MNRWSAIKFAVIGFSLAAVFLLWIYDSRLNAGRAASLPTVQGSSGLRFSEQLIKKDYSYAYVASYRVSPEFNGKNIAEITRQVRGKKKVDDQIEQILEMYDKGGASMVYRSMSEGDVQNIMRQRFTMIASDSGVREFGAGVPHPRGYGNNARVLGHYVRDLKVVTLEDAIRKMTSLPAQTFNLRDRGQIREGFAADLVIFDPATVGDKATFEQPHQYAEGFSSVIVNGQVVFDGTKMTGVMSGQPLNGNKH